MKASGFISAMASMVCWTFTEFDGRALEAMDQRVSDLSVIPYSSPSNP